MSVFIIVPIKDDVKIIVLVIQNIFVIGSMCNA